MTYVFVSLLGGAPSDDILNGLYHDIKNIRYNLSDIQLSYQHVEIAYMQVFENINYYNDIYKEELKASLSDLKSLVITQELSKDVKDYQLRKKEVLKQFFKVVYEKPINVFRELRKVLTTQADNQISAIIDQYDDYRIGMPYYNTYSHTTDVRYGMSDLNTETSKIGISKEFLENVAILRNSYFGAPDLRRQFATTMELFYEKLPL